MTYRNTLIAVADDCPATSAQRPARVGVAEFQFTLLRAHPDEFTHDEVLFRTHHRQENANWDTLRLERWDEFFAQPRACLRASPLPKQHGWGFHCDEEGKVALLAVESAEYQQFLNGAGVKVVKAMRTKREK